MHEAIIDDATWQRVQELLAEHGGRKIGTLRRSAKRLLDGVLYDSNGRLMRTTYAIKTKRICGISHSRRYWYYTSMASGLEDRDGSERVPAGEIERLVLNGLISHLGDKAWLT